MIELDIKYSGNSEDGKPCFINLHNTTFDICAPEYKGGQVRNIDYTSVKHVYSADEALVLKIMRTEVSLKGLGISTARDLAQVIEIGKTGPIEDSKEFRKYKKRAEKEQSRAEKRQERAEERAERRQEHVEKFAAVVDSINRYREQSREEEREEQEQKEREALRKQERYSALESEIEKQSVQPSDSENIALEKLLKLNKLFSKCLSDNDLITLIPLALRTCKDNLDVLEISYPDSALTSRAAEQLKQFEKEYKRDSIQRRVTGLLVLLGIIAFLVFCYFMDDIFPKK